MSSQPSSQGQRQRHIEYRACGDYGAPTPRTMLATTSYDRALADTSTMTLADRVWIETREVILGPWEHAGRPVT